MFLELGHGKYFINEYPQKHPQIRINCDNHQEINDLILEINRLFKPIEDCLKIKYSCSFSHKTVYFDIGDQETKEAVKAVQDAKKKLKNFIDNYNDSDRRSSDDWIIALLTIISIFLLTWIFKFIIIIWNWSNKKLKEQFNLTQLQSTLILSAITIIIVVTAIIATNTHHLLQQQFQSSSQLQELSRQAEYSSSQPEPKIATPSTTLSKNLTNVSPEQLVLDYYAAINQGNYRESWNKLPPDLRNDLDLHPEGYLSFERWYQKIAPVNIKSVKKIKSEEGKAIINASYTYKIDNQIIEQSLNFLLNFDSQQNDWNIASISLEEKQASLPASNPIQSVTFPLDSCGDKLPDDPTAYPVSFYPIFVRYTEENLSKVQSNFCRDAFIKFREKNNRDEIQVGSFIGIERASQFKELLSKTFADVEVGNATLIEANGENP